MKEQPKGRVIYLENKPTPEQIAKLLFGTTVRGFLEMFLEEESRNEG